MEIALLTFKHAGKERKCRPLTLGDLAAVREWLRRERLDALGPRANPTVAGIAVAVAVTEAELNERIFSFEGMAFLLFRACSSVDQTFEATEAEQMALDEDPFVARLYKESKIIADPTPPATGPSDKPSP